MRHTLSLLRSFFVRDFYTEISYRVSFLLNLSTIFFSTLIFYFVSKLVDEQSLSEQLAAYQGDYFSFVIIGIAFAGYFGLGLSGFASALRTAQTTGTLEAMMMTPTPVSTIIVGSALWSYAFTTFRVLIFILLGVLLGVRLEDANYLGALVSLVLGIISFASIGIIAASVIIVIKRGDPIAVLFGSFANFISGVYYPVEVMPDWLQPIAKLIPVTYALNAIRGALLGSFTWRQLAPDLGALLLFCVVLFPVSLLIFRYAVDQARREGTLAHY